MPPYPYPSTKNDTHAVASGAMRGRTITLTIVGFLIGAMAAAGVGVRVIDEIRTSEDATSLPSENILSTTTPLADPVGLTSTIIGSTVLALTEVRVVGQQLAIEYDLISLAPAGTEDAGTAELSAARGLFPRSWVLNTVAGSITGGSLSVNVTIARFELPTGVVLSDITSIEIVDPLVAYPLDISFELSEENPSVELFEGAFVELGEIRRQPGNTTVIVTIRADDPIDASFTVAGEGRGWLQGAESDGHELEGLTWLYGPLPEVMKFRATGVRWLPHVGSFSVSIEGLS